MNLTILPTPILPAGIEAFLGSWLPAKSTKEWTKGSAGCWYDGPLAGIEAEGFDIPREVEVAFAERIRRDYIDRGILDEAVLGPDYSQPYDSKLFNLWEDLHYNLTLLAELHGRGFAWAGQFATRILWSYYHSAKKPWMRNGGEGEKPMLYSDRGRHRIAGQILNALIKMRRLYLDEGRIAESAYCAKLLLEHVKRIDANYPLRDEGQGDGLTVPHCRVFMTGTLLAGLRRCEFLAPEIVTPVVDKYAQIIEAAWRGPGVLPYDIAWDDEKKAFYQHEAEILRDGIYTVNVWVLDFLRRPGQEMRLQPFLDQAKATKYSTKFPIDSIAFFGRIVP